MVDVSKYLERAEKEVKRRNYDAALTLYQQMMQMNPDSGEACAGYLRASLKKHEKSYPPAIVRGLANLPASLCLPLAAMFKAKGWTVNLCMGALKRDPRNPKLSHRLGHALLGLGHDKSAEAAFEVVAEYDQKDLDSLKILGRLAYDRKDIEAALGYYERALKINPRDQEAAKMRKNLAAEGAIQRGGYESARSARDLAKSDRQLKEAERSQKIVRSSEDIAEAIEELEAEISEEGEDVKRLLRLGTLQVQSRNLDDAVDTYLRAKKLAPEDNDVLEHLGEARIRRYDERIAEAEKAMKAGEEDSESRLKRLRGEQLELQIEEFSRRVALHPTDLGLRFRLGRCLLRDERIDEAVEQFQQSVKDPKHRLLSQHLLGRAFAKKGILDLAVKQLQDAAESIPGMTDQRKDVLYDLAKVHERRDAKNEALAVYKEIYESDISFRDVAKKIEALNA